MYLNNYQITRDIILKYTGISLPPTSPTLLPLITRIPSLHEKYAYYDHVLYKYVREDISDILAVPILKEEVEYWKEKRENGYYSVMKLPTIVDNNLSIKFETSGEIYLRTPGPGRFALLPKKENGKYIPILDTNKANSIQVDVKDDWVLHDRYQNASSAVYKIEWGSNVSTKIGRLGKISPAAQTFIGDILIGNFKDLKQDLVYRMGIYQNILYALNEIFGYNVLVEDVAKYAYLCIQECWDQSITNIQADINASRIDLVKHFRALEQAFKVNIYILMDDTLEPYLMIPPHAHFYLPRESNKNWPAMVFHLTGKQYKTDDASELFTLLVGEIAARKYKYTWEGSQILDDIIKKSNRIRIISPDQHIDKPLSVTIPAMKLGKWNAVEQVVDVFGKCRAITYMKKEGSSVSYFTMNIGFASIQHLPLGIIRMPTATTTISQDLGLSVEQVQNLILSPSISSEFTDWIQKEKHARVLRIVTHLLYSQEILSYDDIVEFMENDPGSDRSLKIEEFGDIGDYIKAYPNVIHSITAEEFAEKYIIVDTSVKYDVSALKHMMPNIEGSSEKAWEYFTTTIPGMISDHKIVVPSEETKRALYLHISATPKIKWPMRFPSFIRYSWDINVGKDELVFLSDIDLLQYMIMVRAPLESLVFIDSPIPYILSKGIDKYLIQMAQNLPQAKYIAFKWKISRSNPGYSGSYDNIDYDINNVSSEFTSRLSDISYTVSNGHIFVIIPIST